MKTAVGCLFAVLAAPFLVLALIAAGFGSWDIGGATEADFNWDEIAVAGGDCWTPLAVRDIPAEYLGMYQSAQVRTGVSCAVIAGIYKVETDHGRNNPGDKPCIEGPMTPYGTAKGPGQFLDGTWKLIAGSFDLDGGDTAHPKDGVEDVCDYHDAALGTAYYLRDSGAPGDYRKAVYAYNHATWYVDQVMGWAVEYGYGSVPAPGSGDPVAVCIPVRGPISVWSWPGKWMFYDKPHQGFDIVHNPNEAPYQGAYAPRDGTVRLRYGRPWGDNPGGLIGAHVYSPDGERHSVVWHIDPGSWLVRDGQAVRQRQPLGTYAEVGLADGAHVHHEEYVNGVLQTSDAAYGYPRSGSPRTCA